MFDFGIGASELLFIAIVALIVVGPKDLPRLLRTIGQYSRKIRGLAREFQSHLDEASKEAGLDDVKKEVKGMTNFTVTSDLDKKGNDIKRAIEDTAPKSSGSAAKPSDGKATSAVENAIAESEKPKPDPAAAAKDNGAKDTSAKDTSAKDTSAKDTSAKDTSAKSGAEKPKSDTAKADKPKADEPKGDEPKADKPKTDKPKAAKSKPAPKAKQQAGRSHETMKS